MDTTTRPPDLDLAAGAVVSHWKENGRPVYPGDELAVDLVAALDQHHRARMEHEAARVQVGQLTPMGAATLAGLELIGKAVGPASAEAAAEVEAQDQERRREQFRETTAELDRNKIGTVAAVLAHKHERTRQDQAHALDVARREVWHSAGELAAGDQTEAGDRLAVWMEARAVGTLDELAALGQAPAAHRHAVALQIVDQHHNPPGPGAVAPWPRS